MEYVCMICGKIVAGDEAPRHAASHGYPLLSARELVARGALQRLVTPEDIREALVEVLGRERGQVRTVRLSTICRMLGVRGPAMARYVLETLEKVKVDGWELVSIRRGEGARLVWRRASPPPPSSRCAPRLSRSAPR